MTIINSFTEIIGVGCERESARDLEIKNFIIQKSNNNKTDIKLAKL